MFIYKVTNIITGKSYIGQTIHSIEYRWKNHINASKRSKNYFHRAIQKHGAENFVIKCVVRCSSREELNIREVAMIRIYGTLSPNGYNMATGGKSKVFTDEMREKMSISAKINPAKYWLGKNLTQETKDKIAYTKKIQKQSLGSNNAMYGKKHTEKSKLKNCLSNGSGIPFEVVCIETGTSVGVWHNKAKCARDLGIAREQVRDTLKGKWKTTSGYYIRYV